MRITLVVLLTLFFSSTLFSQEYSGILKAHESDNIELKEGDSFVAELIIWPINMISEGSFSTTFKDKTILSYFHLTEVISEGFSDNNKEAYSIKMRLILTKFFDNRNFVILSYMGLNIPVSLKAINPVPLKGRTQQFVLLSQEYAENIEKAYWQYLLITLLLFLSAWFVRKKMIKNKEKRDFQNKKNIWIKEFSNAKERTNFEYIYFKKSDWSMFTEALSPDTLSFFNTINEYQFKEVWSEEDNQQVNESFDKIRNLFN